MKNKFEFNNGEGIPPEKKIPKEQTSKGTSKRLMRAVETQLKIQLGAIEINGEENLKKLPDDKKVVIATTHISDMDIPLAIYALGNDLDLVITNESIHHKFTGEPAVNIGMRLAGKDSFLPIDFTGKGEKKHPTAFNPDNFAPMIEALNKGRAIIVAGHNPSLEGHMEKGGYGAVYLAEMTDAVILPVSIDILSEENLGTARNIFRTFLKKPDAHIQIGSPFSLDEIEGIERMKELMDKRKNGIHLTPEEISEFSKVTKDLKTQSEILAKKLAEITPEGKRGNIVLE